MGPLLGFDHDHITGAAVFLRYLRHIYDGA
jgi:hypothetical protein